MPNVVLYAIKSKFVVHVKQWNVKHFTSLIQLILSILSTL